jgi:urease accessory protein
MCQMKKLFHEYKLNNNPFALLQMLQHGDSQFPSGSFAFSAGLERLCADDRVNSTEEISSFIKGQLRYRWATLDRVALVNTFRLGNDLKMIAVLDRNVEAMNLSEGLREGSKRNGCAFLSMHTRLKTPLANDFRLMISAGKAFGHIPVVQGLMWNQVGLTETQAETAAAHGICSDLLGVAIRLGKIGHIHAQQIRSRMNLVIAMILDNCIKTDTIMHAYLPAAEIAAMRHETSELCLFAN